MLQPAARLLNHYSLKTKFTVIGVAIAVVTAVPLLHLTAIQFSAVRSATSELNGLDVQRPLRTTLQAMLDLRAAQMAGDVAAAKVAAGKVDLASRKLDAAIASYGRTSVSEGWKGAYEPLKRIVKDALDQKADSSAKTADGAVLWRTALTGTFELVTLVADVSGQTVDPRVDSLYLAANATVHLPTIAHALTQFGGPALPQKAQADEGDMFGDLMGDAPAAKTDAAPAAAEKPAEPAAAPAASAATASAATASAPVASAAAATAAPAEPPAAAPVSASAGQLFQTLSRLEDAHATLLFNLDKIILERKELKEGQQQARREYTLAFNDYIEDARALLEHPERSLADSETALRDRLFKLQDVMLNQFEQQVRERRADTRKGLMLEWVVVLGLAGLLYLLFRTIQASVVGNVRRIKDGINRIATGDLQTTIHISSHDELRDVADGINRMTTELRDLLSVAQASSETLYQEVDRMHQSSLAMQQTTADQSGAASTMVSSINDLSAGISQIAYQAQQGSEVSSRTSAISEESGQVIHRMAEEMSTISESVRTTATAIESLGEHSDKISSVVQVIKEVAGQTNLLALNAAIEAARAGEQGRGFAVVADEVRKLAERTTRSTQEIAEIIESIQDATMNAILSMGSVVSRVNEGVELASSAGNAITQIRAQGEETQAVINEISSTLQQHASTGELLTERVQTIAAKASETSEEAAVSAQATENMYELASRIQETVGRFRIS